MVGTRATEPGEHMVHWGLAQVQARPVGLIAGGKQVRHWAELQVQVGLVVVGQAKAMVVPNVGQQIGH